jgi:glucose/arabinose dehydrogenase
MMEGTVFRRFIVPGLMMLAITLSMRQAEVIHATVPINFVRGTLTGSGFTTVYPTSIAVDPDGKLYVADGGANGGKIQALTVNTAASTITALQQVTTATDLQEVYGIAFDPTDGSSPRPIYVTNTVSGFGDAGTADPGTFPGKITKISGAGYATRTDIITGLPVSNSGHEANGLAFGPDGRLYINQGSTTNAGLVSTESTLFKRVEVPTSGAVLVADVKAIGFNGNITYNPAATYSDTVDQTGGDVQPYATGLRNPYDLVFHSNGQLYLTDNGPNGGYGKASTSCSTQSATDASALDELNRIVAGGYYGHPNRNRGRTDARQCVYHAGTEASSGGYTAPIEANLPASSDGLVEYTSNKFGGQMQGDLLYVSWVSNELRRVKLSPDGLSVVSDTVLATGLANALDVTVGPDGTIYVAEYGGGKITYFRPDETPVSSVSVISVSPNVGPVTGGQSVTITGSNFTTTAETTATIGGQPLAGMTVQNSTTITGTTPAGSLGLQNVVVTNSISTGTLTGGYSYVSGGGTTPPVAVAGPDLSTPIAHITHAHVTLDGRSSFDPDGFIVSYSWSEGGTVVSTNPVDSIQLVLGEHLLTLTVTDNDGYSTSDDVRIVVTQFAENPQPYYCFDVNGDKYVNSIDLGMVAAVYGKRFGQPGYSRLKDWNGDRTINSADLGGTARDMTTYSGGPCPLVDQQIRTATAGMEPYQDVRVAQAAGYFQVTPFIAGQGRHMMKGSLEGQDLIFDPAQPESLLYEPDSSTPGGWRLGGAMFVIPYTLTTLPPDGFAGNEDAWHYHDSLCLWNNFASVSEGTPESTCLAHSGNPVWIARAGWLVHIWNYVANPVGRFVEVSDKFVGLP